MTQKARGGTLGGSDCDKTNELITLRTNGVEDAMKSMKDIESLFDKVTSNYRPLLNGERYLSDVEVSHRLKSLVNTFFW